MRLALHGREGVALAQASLDPFHRVAEVLCFTGPARRIDAGRPVERIDRKPGIRPRMQEGPRRARQHPP